MQMPPALLQMLAQRFGGGMGAPPPAPVQPGAAPVAGAAQPGAGARGAFPTMGEMPRRTGGNFDEQRNVDPPPMSGGLGSGGLGGGGAPNASRPQMNPQMLMQMLPMLLQHLGGGLGSNLPFYTQNAPLSFGAPHPQQQGGMPLQGQLAQFQQMFQPQQPAAPAAGLGAAPPPQNPRGFFPGASGPPALMDR